MKPFLDQDFLLDTPTSRTLYHQYAAKEPVMDYHCHIDPKAIYEDMRYENITQVWLGGDHYKWRLMRAAGVDERFVTGDAPDLEKFQHWAETISRAIGNPVYHWSHLELRRFFGYEGVLNADTAEQVWTLCNEKLAQPDFSVRGLIRQANVTLICTTDDPADTLEWHEKLAADDTFAVTVLPAWRPDKAMNIEKAEFTEYLRLLGAAAGQEVTGWDTLQAVLKTRMQFFHEHGCRLSDHALDYVMYDEASDAEISTLFAKKMAGEELSAQEVLLYKTAFMRFVGEEYGRMGWVMQLHYGCKRNNNDRMFQKIGADTGYDCINSATPSAGLADYLNSLGQWLPKTIVYSLNPNDDAIISTVNGCFQGDGVLCKMQHGSAWWFNDHLDGMEKQMKSLASTGYLAGFVGMLTDSRSFLSYPRHEYFRRILCKLLGEWVENGLYPNDEKILGSIAQDISYRNALQYFDFPFKA